MAVGVEGHAERLQLAHARRRLLAQHAHGALAGRRRGRRRACRPACSSGESSSASAAAIPPWAQKLAVCASGERLTSATLGAQLGGHQRREQPRRAGADHRDVGAQERFGRGLHGASVRYRRACRSSSPPLLARARHRVRRTPSGRSASARSSAPRRSATGSATSAARRPRPSWTQLLRGAPARARGGGARAERARRRVRPRHPAQPGLLGRGAARRRRRVRAGGVAAAAAASGWASPRCARPGHHGEPARAMGFCLFANVVDGRAPRARLARRRAGAGARLGRAPRQRHERDLPLVARGALREHPPVPVLSGHRAARATWGRARARATRSTCRCPPGAGEDVFCALVEHVVLPAARQFEPDLVLLSAGLRRPPRRPGRGLRARDLLVRRARRGRCSRLGVPVGAVLEGGYDLDALADGVAATMEALADGRRARRPTPSSR